MEANPYAAPSAVVDDVRSFRPDDLEARKATRGQRLGAALLDGVLQLLWIVPIVLMAARYNKTNGLSSEFGLVVWIVIAMVVAIGLVVINCLLLHRHGQTIGKRALGIKIVRSDGSRVGLGRVFVLRFLPITLLGMVPMIGRLVSLADVLAIFASERRCLHDMIADTIVIDC